MPCVALVLLGYVGFAQKQFALICRIFP